MIEKFRKKQIVIDAIHMDEHNLIDIENFVGKQLQHGDTYILIPTLEGTMTANIGDWIIKGIKGEFYPCKPYIFSMTYEKVTDEEILKSIPVSLGNGEIYTEFLKCNICNCEFIWNIMKFCPTCGLEIDWSKYTEEDISSPADQTGDGEECVVTL